MEQSEESVQSPWLLYLDFSKKEQVFCSPSRPHRRFLQRIPILWKKVIYNCTYGWIFLRSNASRYMLFNPGTRRTIHLPVLLSKPRRDIRDAILWLPPDNPRSMVLLFDVGRKTVMFCYIHQKQWFEASYEREANKIVEERGDGRVWLIRPVICNERLYALLLSRPYLLVEINISDQNCLQIKSLECEVPVTDSHSSTRQWCLAESQGDLFTIEIVYGGVDFAETIDMGVFKLDFSSSKKQWRKVKGSEIKDRAFFLSDENQPVSCTTAGQDFEGGHVYFVADGSKSLCSFNVEDGSVTMSLPLRKFSSIVWVTMPKLRVERGSVNGKMKGINGMRRKFKNRIGFSELSDSKGECKWINFGDLPHDVMELVAKKLTPLDYMNFRATCKTCCQMAPPVKWRESRFVHDQTHSLPPFLMLSKSDRAMHHFIDPEFGNMFTVVAPDSLAGAKIRCSRDGWVLMTNIGENSFFFYNPFAKKIIKLPEAPEDSTDCDSFCFTNIPSSPECIVMGVGFTGFYYFDTMEQEWSHIQYQDLSDFPDDLSIHNTPVFFKGAFHFLGTEGSLSMLTIEDEDLTIYDRLRCPCEDVCQNFLLEWDGKLTSVFINNKWTKLQVFTLNEKTMVWEEVSSLGKYSLFLSRFSAFCVATNVPKMENKAYLSKIYGEDNILFYCFKTKSFGSSGSQKRRENFCGTKEYLSSRWIEPDWKESREVV